jgi:hypothetical protein
MGIVSKGLKITVNNTRTTINRFSARKKPYYEHHKSET